MNLILLSGGSGKRLWPLSNDVRSKQFLKIFKRPDGSYESMVQRIFRQVHEVDPGAGILITTSRSQVSALRNQLGEKVDVCIEPCRRDTFPAIALACAYLHEIKKMPLDEPVVVCPVDPYVNNDYFEMLTKIFQRAKDTDQGLVLMGIEPTYPSEKYGYIIPESKDPIASVRSFKEKPDAETAASYISQGALWNGGVFGFKIGHVLQKAEKLLSFSNYQDLYDHYDSVQKISFDYAFVEKEPQIEVIRFRGQWLDAGTWNTLSEVMTDPVIGKAELDDTCEGTTVVNELNLPILCMGLKNVVVAASPDGILVADKDRSSHMKPYVDKLEQPIRYAEKSWGSYEVLDVQKSSMTILVTLKPGSRMNYHSHDHRNEIWAVLSGNGETVVDGMKQPVKPGDVITIEAGVRHTIIALTELKVIEVQLGEEISVHDKHKYALDE